MKTDDLVRTYIYLIMIENDLGIETITSNDEITQKYIDNRERILTDEMFPDLISKHLHYLSLRARLNSQRLPEVYVLTSESTIDFDDLYTSKELIDLIRKRGIKVAI